MRTLFLEIRRYLRPITLIIVSVFALFWYVLYGDINRSNTSNYSCPYNLSLEYKQRFGNTIDRSELEEIKKDYADIIEELDALYDEYVGGYGVHSKADYDLIFTAITDGKDSKEYGAAVEKWGEENLKKIYDVCHDVYWKDPINILEFKQQGIRGVIEHFELLDSVDIDSLYESKAARDRLKEYRASGEVSLLQTTFSADSYFEEQFKYWALFIYIICALITVPVLVGNRVTNVQSMQFASKRGRAILKNQLAAAMAITVFVNLAVDAFFCGVAFFAKYNTRHLLDCSLNTGAIKTATWFSMTFGQYVLIILCRTLLMSLALTCLLFIMSYFFNNYVGVMAISIPCVALMHIYSGSIEINLYIIHSPVIYPLTLLIPIATAAAVTIIVMRRIRQTDYLY